MQSGQVVEVCVAFAGEAPRLGDVESSIERRNAPQRFPKTQLGLDRLGAPYGVDEQNDAEIGV